jgi:pimeloyl-ACP methyl ester carboxylesterase
VIKKKKIVLLHGWGASIEKLRLLASQLEKKNWQVFIPKLPGFDILPPKNAWGVGEYADHVLNEAHKVYGKDEFFVFGHSFGGRVAIKLLGVILCSTAGVSRGYSLKRVVFYILAKVGKIFLLIPPLAKFWRKLLYMLAREHDYEKTQGVMKDTFKKIVSENLRPAISNIRLPVLVLWGKKDQATPIKDAYYIRKTLSSSKLVVFENEGHRLPYNEPKKVAEEINKWAKNLN